LTFASGINRYVSFTRLSQRRPYAPVLIGLALIALVALLPAAASGGAKTHLEFRLSAPPHQDLVGDGAIEARVRCLGEPCTVVASATSRNPALHTGQARIKIAAGNAATLSLPLPKQQRGKLKAALEAGRSPIFTVKATAHDKGGTYIPLTLEVESKQP
jgi:hypothetical protein